MKNKKIIIFFIILLIIGVVFFMVMKQNNSKNTNDNNSVNEYTPEEEISSDQLRQTKVILFFADANSNELKNEGKQIDSYTLLKNPYKELVSLLLSGPSSTELKSVIPADTKILDATLENNCVILNFSPELLNFADDTQKYNIVNSLLNTLSQLNEVESIKILIDGNMNDAFEEAYNSIH